MINDAFELIKEEYLPECRSNATLYRHRVTGAQVFSLGNDDDENFFCFGFRTPPHDDTGVAHILEHTVLAGSAKYPVKDPFLSMLKGSMHTFLNAMTYPDKTLYPASSTVEQDFFNLMSVYGDAVFFPLLRPEAFRQEGWRDEIAGEKLTRVGVVLNEMKGAYGSHENFAFDKVSQSLFPQGPYSYDSGGDPEKIPLLTHGEFTNFHNRYYHPSNCHIFLYGSIADEKKLAFLQENFLGKFHSALPVNSAVPPIKAFAKPVSLSFDYPAPEGESPLATVSVNRLLCPVTDVESVLALRALNEILLGTPGSPLYMALQQSGIGEDVSPITGLGLDYDRVIFAAAIREVKRGRERELLPLIESTLRDFIKTGPDALAIEAALRSMELSLRELRGGPVGLRLMSRLYRGWNHDLDPFVSLKFDEAMTRLRAKAFSKGFWEDLVTQYLLENPHGSTVITTPNFELFKEKKRAEETREEEAFKALTGADKARLAEEAASLKTYQESVDPAGVTPRLSLKDVPIEVKPTLCDDGLLFGRPLYTTNAFTNGVSYFRMAFACADLSREEQFWLPFFCHALAGVGRRDASYDKVAGEIALNTGALSFDLDSGAALNDGAISARRAYLTVRFSALAVQLHDAPETVYKTLFESDFSDAARMSDLFFEMYNNLKNAVIPSGSSFATTRLSAAFSSSGVLEETWYGLDQLFFLDSLKSRIKEPSFITETSKKFDALRAKLFVKNRVSFAVSVENNSIDAFKNAFSRMPDGTVQAAPIDLLTEKHPNEGMETRGNVNYVGLALPSVPFDTDERAALMVFAHYMGSGPLWETIRMKGGAYGASAHASSIDPVFFFSSYRDPHIAQTVQAYRSVLENFTGVSAADLERAIIGKVGRDIHPMSPEETLAVTFRRKLYDFSDAMRQRMRDRYLALTPGDITAAAGHLAARLDEAKICVIGFEKSLKEAKAAGLFDLIKTVPN